ncbi:MAG: dynamin family protein [Polyangiaceae bacterium]
MSETSSPGLESFHAKKREVTAAISELSTVATQVGARSLATRIDADLVQKLHADRFHLVVVGEFNHGKTTFVNALLGRNILPVGVTPTTAVIHHVEYSETPTAAVVRMNGDRSELSFEDVRRYAVQGDHEKDSNEVRFLEVGLPSPLLKERIVLVDTPGVNDLSLQRADITYSYIPKSDAVLFLLDAGQPLKESERVFLEQKLLAEGRNKIIFIVTKRDIWEPSEEKEALAYIRTELAKLVESPVVFPVSAERSLEEKPDSGFPELTTHLMKFLAEERGRILLDNALGESIEAGVILSKGIDARRRAVQMSSAELTRRIDILEKDLAGQAKTIEQRRGGIREEVSAIKAWVGRDLEHFVEDVIKQLPSMIDEAKPDEIKLHLGPFLERTFVEWAEKETKEIAKALEALAEKTVALVRDDAHDAAKRLSGAIGGDIKAPNVTVDSLRYDLGVTALAAVGVGVAFTHLLLGGVLAVAALPLALWVRHRNEKLTREKARELAPRAIRDAAGKLQPKLDEMISEFAEKLDAWVVSAGEELHRELIEILKKARTEASAGAQEVTNALSSCDQQASALGKVSARLADLRGSLASMGARPAEPAAS